MAYVTVKEMLWDAKKRNYAVGAFNAENMEGIQAVIQAAEELDAPVILQTTPSMVRYASCELYFGMVYALAQTSSVPVALHLDHGDSIELVETALNAGYSSIMIDGSMLEFEQNVALTKRAAEICAKDSIPVEAELGSIGGKEDDLEVKNSGYTDPGQATEFVRRSGASSLAVSIGTAHGVYAKQPKLDLDRLALIASKVDVPLVLHGASGLTEQDVKNCIQRGICKVNFATELRIAYTKGVKQALEETPEIGDPKQFGKVAREKVKQIVKHRILVCGADKKA